MSSRNTSGSRRVLWSAMLLVVAAGVVAYGAGAATPAASQPQGIQVATTQPRTMERFSSPPGEAVDFTVQPVVGEGQPFHAAAARGKYVVLHFLLETSCPHCMTYTHEYATAKLDPDMVQVFLKRDSQQEVKLWASRYDKQWNDLPVIYGDPKSQLAKRLDIPFGYAFHGTVVHFPALILLDPQGREVYRYVGKKNTDRCRPDHLAEVMKKVRAAATQTGGRDVGPDRAPGALPGTMIDTRRSCIAAYLGT